MIEFEKQRGQRRRLVIGLLRLTTQALPNRVGRMVGLGTRHDSQAIMVRAAQGGLSSVSIRAAHRPALQHLYGNQSESHVKQTHDAPALLAEGGRCPQFYPSVALSPPYLDAATARTSEL